MGIAFSRGIGDYVCLFEPTASLLQKEKSFYILKPLGSECERVPYTCYCASREYISENPKVIQSFTNAVHKAQTWMLKHSAEEIAKVILPYFVDSSLEILINCVQNYMDAGVWCKSPVVDQSSFDLIQHIMIEAGELEKNIDFNVNVVYNIDIIIESIFV